MVNVAIVGVGNCASSLVQGIHQSKNSSLVGEIFKKIGRCKTSDINVVAAFDIDMRKVGKDLADAIFCEPNCATKIVQPDETGVVVKMGPVMDGVSESMSCTSNPRHFRISSEDPVHVVDELIQNKVDVLVNFLPVGSNQATRFYADCCLSANAHMINAIPSLISHDAKMRGAFENKGLRLFGDDIKSQFGATIFHRSIVSLMAARGLRITQSYQLNIGGNSDFANMMDESRLHDKRTSKTESVKRASKNRIKDSSVRIGPSDFVGWMDDEKHALIRVEAAGYLGQSISIDLKLAVQDSPNSAAVVADLIRWTQVNPSSQDEKELLEAINAFYMKYPHIEMDEDTSLEVLSRCLG